MSNTNNLNCIIFNLSAPHQVIQQELNIDGLLDINIPISNHSLTTSHITAHPQSTNVHTQRQQHQQDQQHQQQHHQHLQQQQQQHQLQQQSSLAALSIAQQQQPNQSTMSPSNAHSIVNQYPQTSVTPPSWVH